MARTLRDLIPGHIHEQSLMDLIISLVGITKPEGSDDVYVRLVRVYLTISSDNTNTTFILKQKGQFIATDHTARRPVLSSNTDKLTNAISIVKVCYFTDYFASLKVPLLDDKV
ncbi:hypothetical protein EC957_006177 [Mortierella hygrophila]|uniref:Uncharacterized protein n=1 Tax=Mortierella hygrophila TaxID=979708 RepID=A0A9P6EZT0_9FUNG|nr:hypothetical protein EC957_006177 [Mortierella hygrophila]